MNHTSPQVADPLLYERTYVASVFAQPALADEHRLSPETLSHAPFAIALAVMAKLRMDGQRITPTTLTLALGSSVTNPRELVAELRDAPIDTDLAPVASQIRAAAMCRSMAAGAAALARASERGDLGACRDVIGRLVLAHDAGDQAQPVMTMRELLTTTIEAVSRESSQNDARQQIPVGMPQIDTSYKLSPGQMLVIGAQTNVGKSSLITTWLLSIAKRGTPVGIVTVEDPPEDFGAKILGDLTGINPARMWAGRMSPAEWESLQKRWLAHVDLPLSSAYVGSRSIDDVLARIEFMARVRGVRVVAVDYLQAISHRSGKDLRERIDRSLEELIALCGRLGVALILASQLSRPDKGSPFKEPQLIDLKESGSIENRAQCVVMLWRENDKPNAPVKAKIAKAKRQPAGVRFTLSRDPDTGMLVDAASLEPDES